MKFLSSIALLAALAIAAPLENSEAKRDPQPTKERHFYTVSTNEFATVQNQGYQLDGSNGNIGYAYDHQVDGTVPMYRWLNSQYNLHFWTTDASGAGLSNIGYHYEGIAWWFSASQTAEWSQTVDRYVQNNGDHLYTTNIGGNIGTGAVYNREGTVGYTGADSSNGKTQVYSFVNEAFS